MANDGTSATNEPLAVAVRTLLAGGMLVDSAHRKPEYVAVSCHRVDDFGVSVSYLVVLGDARVSAQAAAARQHADHEGAHLIIVADDVDSDEHHISWPAFLARLGGPLRSWLPLEPEFATRLSELGHNRLPAGITGRPDNLFEEYVLAGLQFAVGNRVIRYGQDRRFERVPDGVAWAGDPPSFFIYDAKAAGTGFVVDVDAVRQFGDYVRRFNERYRLHTGRVQSFVVASGHFDMTNEACATRSDSLYAECGTRLSFLTAEELSKICALLNGSPTMRSSLPWGSLLARLHISADDVNGALGAARKDGIAH